MFTLQVIWWLNFNITSPEVLVQFGKISTATRQWNKFNWFIINNAHDYLHTDNLCYCYHNVLVVVFSGLHQMYVDPDNLQGTPKLTLYLSTIHLMSKNILFSTYTLYCSVIVHPVPTEFKYPLAGPGIDLIITVTKDKNRRSNQLCYCFRGELGALNLS